MTIRNAKSKKASNSANYRWSKSKDDANAMRTQCDGNAIKEKKVKDYTEDIARLKSEIEPNRYLDFDNAVKQVNNELNLKTIRK